MEDQIEDQDFGIPEQLNEEVNMNHHANEDFLPQLQAMSEIDQIGIPQRLEFTAGQADEEQVPLAIREIGSSSDRRSKRKAQAHDVDDLSQSSKQQLAGEWSGEGLVVPLEPPLQP